VRIGILTNNFSKLNRITRKLKNAEFNLIHLKRIPQIDHEIDVLVTDEIVMNCLTPHVVPGNLEILELKIRCAYYQKKRLSIGIDPGGISGLVALANKQLLFKKEFDNINSMVNVITSIENEIGIQNVKIGLGSPPIRNLIVTSLKNFKNKLQFIDERRSGSGSHIEAAIRIASRLPELNEPSNYSPKDGEIAWIQKQSRRLSKGLITVNKKTANRILLGEISMEDAVRKYTERLIKTNQ
tara:strand:- start:371 stop:1090 length:720 start_codon:yes stop_codon:yes gene_type:complete